MPVTPAAPDLRAQLLQTLARLGFDAAQGKLGLAVSGGSDSLSLMYLAHAAGLQVRVATVDHGLRPESAFEAQRVGEVAQSLGLPHDILRWQGWDGRGNVQDRARRARRALLAAWAQGHGLDGVALAHTKDDLAEGFVMRLARGAGVDGLAAMQPRFVAHGAVFLRPLLWAERGQLRGYLAQKGADWIDDPSNDMLRFDRVRARKALPALAKLGLGTQVLADVAQHLAQARDALDWASDDLARACLTTRAGIITLAPKWQTAPSDLQRRLIQRIVLWIAPTDYPPRGAALTAAIARLHQGAPTQLAGCHFLPHQGQMLAFREAARSAPPCAPAQTWDVVWQWACDAPQKTCTIRPLGADGLAQWQGWREAGLPRAALIAQPSLWAADALLTTPLWPASPEKSAFFRHPNADRLFSMRLSD